MSTPVGRVPESIFAELDGVLINGMETGARLLASSWPSEDDGCWRGLWGEARRWVNEQFDSNVNVGKIH